MFGNISAILRFDFPELTKLRHELEFEKKHNIFRHIHDSNGYEKGNRKTFHQGFSNERKFSKDTNIRKRTEKRKKVEKFQSKNSFLILFTSDS